MVRGAGRSPCSIPLIVYDLEFTAWAGSRERNWQGPGEHREIVQIGAVKVDGATWEEFDWASWFVKPRINPVLSDYFTNLTRISQEQIDREGMDFSSAWRSFAAFAEGAVMLVSNGPDHDVIEENCRLNHSARLIPAERFLNIGPVLAGAGRVHGHLSSAHLPDVFPEVPRLPAHDALADARMVAKALAVARALGWALPGFN